NASAVKQTMLFLTNFFHLRSCPPLIPDENDFRHCLQNIIRNCSAPCINKISQTDYQKKIEELKTVLSGNISQILPSITTQMQNFAANKQFEKAAEIRDIINNLKSLFVSSQRKFTNARIQKGGGIEAATELQKLLHLPVFPHRIECFDNSNLFGNQAVASMVCFIDGKPAPSQYRRYKIKTVEGIDDFASMNEVVGRRYTRVINENLPRPDLIIIDGGQGQLSAAISILKNLGLSPVIFDPYSPVLSIAPNEIIIMGLAKKKEELYIPGLPATVFLPRHSQALHMLQFLRDEAHRFAITFHREYRAKAIASSVLDDIEGVGEKRKKILLNHFGSVARLRKASIDEISNVKGIGIKFASSIFQALNKKG
ncbi:MAG: helix-hairpin-helix domain-containing protein, partial [Lentisphaeria bacterium]